MKPSLEGEMENMTVRSVTRSQAFFFGLIHLTLTAGFLYLFFQMSSCAPPKLDEPDLGAEVTPQEFEKAVDEAFTGVTGYGAKEGDYVSFDLSARLIGSPEVNFLLNIYHEVIFTEIDKETGIQSITTAKVETDLTKTPPRSSPPEEQPVEQYLPPTGASQLLERRLQGQGFQLKGASLLRQSEVIRALKLEPRADERPVVRVSLHNLSLQKNLVAEVPQKVSDRPDCGGVKNCSYGYHLLRFDEVLWYNEKEFEVQRYEIQISADPPHMGAMVSNCVSYPFQQYVLRQCQSLKDFGRHEKEEEIPEKTI